MSTSTKVGGIVTVVGLLGATLGAAVEVTVISPPGFYVAVDALYAASVLCLTLGVGVLMVFGARLPVGTSRLLGWVTAALAAFTLCSSTIYAIQIYLQSGEVPPHLRQSASFWLQAVGYGLAGLGLLVVTIGLWRVGSDAVGRPEGADSVGAVSAAPARA